MTAMFAPLADDEINRATKCAPKSAEKTPILPVPDDAPPMRFRHPTFGEPVRAWPYRDAIGRLVFYVARFEYADDAGNQTKDYLPISFCDTGNGRRGWRAKGIPDPRPLYNLPEIVARPDAPVIVTEGEKAADAAAILFPDMVATTPPHGAKSPHKADWSAVAGRSVIIATDNDDAGQQFGDKVCDLARKAGAAEVRHLPPDRLGAWVWKDGVKTRRDGDLPTGWDVADALAEGWTAEAVAELKSDPGFMPIYRDAEERETARRVEAGEPEELTKWPFRIVANGVEKRVERADRETGIITIEWKWFCSALEVIAETRSGEGEDWGRLLCITDRDHRVKTWAMPMAMLAGDGTAYRERLLSLGLIMAPGKFARDALHEYVSTARPEAKARCVNRIGWSGSAFVLPRNTFGGH
jgi:hypothetical protein